MWDRKKYFFFLASVRVHTFCACVTSLSGKAAGTGRNFFCEFWFHLSLSLIHSPDSWYLLFPPLFRLPIFFKPRHTHEKKTPHNVRKRLIRAAAPPSSLFWLCHVCVCVCVNVSARAQRHLFFSPSKKFSVALSFVWTFFSLTMKKKSLTRHYPPQQQKHIQTLPQHHHHPDLSSPYPPLFTGGRFLN
jgi:hypothetical protein